MGASRTPEYAGQLRGERAPTRETTDVQGRGPAWPGLLLIGLAISAGTAGCGVLGGEQAPDAPRIEAASGAVPDDLRKEGWVRELWPADTPPVVARLQLENGSFLFLTDWKRQPRCRLLYVAQGDGSDRRYSRAACGPLPSGDRAADKVLDLYSDQPTDGVSPRITTGTVDSSVEELRITFTECGSRTYALDGPTVPSKPTRRVFMLDLGDCTWGKLEALRNGQVVETYESYPNAD